jgi:hypothetical protein
MKPVIFSLSILLAGLFFSCRQNQAQQPSALLENQTTSDSVMDLICKNPRYLGTFIGHATANPRTLRWMVQDSAFIEGIMDQAVKDSVLGYRILGMFARDPVMLERMATMMAANPGAVQLMLEHSKNSSMMNGRPPM